MEKSCASWGCYSQADTCDLYRDCRDGTDEQNCGGQCPHQICTSGRCALRHWFNDGEVDCPVFSTGKAEDENTDAILSDCIFSCKSSGCISLAMIGDGHEDCKGPEGALDELLGRLEGTVCTLTYTLRNVTPGSVNATSGSMNATSWAPRCVLYRDGYGDVIGCRDGSHLEDCEEFMCPEGYVKCPRSYCVPLHYLLDGRVDCALGEDEGVQDLRARSNLACMSTGGSPVFLHPSLVCDGVRQCPLGDDEWDCFVWCAPGLVCMGGAVVVAQGNTQLALQNPSNLFDQRTKYVDLSHQLLTSDFFSKVDGKLEHVLFLRLSNCGLTSLQTLIFGKMSTYSNFYGVERLTLSSHCHCARQNDPQRSPPSYNLKHRKSNGAVEKYGTRDFRTLLYADLSYNQLTSLGGKWGGLGQMVNLRFLNLSHNRGLVVTRVDFQKCAGHVQTLDLSYTRVAVLTRELLSDFQQLLALYLTGCPLSALRPVFPRTLQTLDLRHTDLVTIEPNAFNEITSLEALYAPDYKICCPQVRGPTVPAYACKAENDALSSCTDLMGQPILKALLWIVGVAALLGNFIVVIYRIVYDRRVLVKSYGMFILNLSKCSAENNVL
ncbi:G-protein coupled receptor GRL101 [Aplysia californica]|uniref:G-protein coupled receptor GRL101 n=1 Tax=Aplysia californica TaxID=6500 RepID=A0ABM1A5M1_APLCA|nr:G-protein coupled receptor GRL101 [Aplysia californica]